MELRNDEPIICESCEERLAVKKYTRAGTLLVCALCFDRLTVQEALDAELIHINDLGSAGRFDEAVALLDSILEANRSLDHDGWLAGSVALQRAAILFKAGRYAEAERTYEEWARIGFIDLWRRQMYTLGLAETLEAQGRDREAVAVLQDVLSYEDPDDKLLALIALRELVRLSEKLGEPLDPRWLKTAEAIARFYNVEMPIDVSPAKAILALEEIVRSRQ